MMSVKIRTMTQLDLHTGASKETTVNVPCTLAHYIRAINNLNKTAHIYGIVYLPSSDDVDYREYTK